MQDICFCLNQDIAKAMKEEYVIIHHILQFLELLRGPSRKEQNIVYSRRVDSYAWN